MREQLQDDEHAQYFFLAALENYERDDRMDDFLLAVRMIIDARGKFSDVARKAKVSKAYLCKVLSHKGNPSFQILKRVMNAVGITFVYPTLDARHKNFL